MNQVWKQLQFGWWGHLAACTAYEQLKTTYQTSQQNSSHFSDPIDLLHGLQMSSVQQGQVTATICVLAGSNSISTNRVKSGQFGFAVGNSVLLEKQTPIHISQNTTVTSVNSSKHTNWQNATGTQLLCKRSCPTAPILFILSVNRIHSYLSHVRDCLFASYVLWGWSYKKKLQEVEQYYLRLQLLLSSSIWEDKKLPAPHHHLTLFCIHLSIQHLHITYN